MEDSRLAAGLLIENERLHRMLWEKKGKLTDEQFKLLESLIVEGFSISEEEREKRNVRINEINEEMKRLDQKFNNLQELIKSNKARNVLSKIMGVEQASLTWGLSPDRIKHLCAEGKVKATKIGKTWIIDKDQDNPSTRKRKEEELELGLKKIVQEYEEIMNSEKTSYEKDVSLGELMTKMEWKYKIPMLQNLEWESKNKEVIELYRKISLSRAFN